ncbi:RNA polymerase sigma-70 factor [Plesiocystis pacifica SIR-1]|uniref:RNA polymerase sigma-70 factor n=1 Tax=Plesiocystis pacifica SIR-1 TaxID=391625 RepID=A6GIU1_9BACT|nr:sigma-70 family RNA polymerase sigma factor [Plesiocystis pacifica]EDM74207.1 RNA polymerase sigma-70 factor [Plesiocystis pacifica SIR-1]
MQDSDLLQAWAAGDQLAGEQLFERHFEAVARFFRNKLPADTRHEDLIQQTFLGCVEARERFRGEASFRTFLFAVARNQLSKHWRSRSRDRLDLQTVSVFDLDASPSAALARDEDQQLLLMALRRIPLDHQVALELHYWESLTAAEIGAVLDVPLGTAKTRIRRAKQLLEAELSALRRGDIAMADTLTRLDTWARELRESLFDESS